MGADSDVGSTIASQIVAIRIVSRTATVMGRCIVYSNQEMCTIFNDKQPEIKYLD